MALKITFRADGATARRVRELFPGAVMRRGGCEVEITGAGPGEVAEKARDLLEKVKGSI